MSSNTVLSPAWLLLSAHALADSDEAARSGGESAGILLLVLGLVAVLLGIRNLRELRHKHLSPPRRPHPRGKKNEPSRDHKD